MLVVSKAMFRLMLALGLSLGMAHADALPTDKTPPSQIDGEPSLANKVGKSKSARKRAERKRRARAKAARRRAKLLQAKRIAARAAKVIEDKKEEAITAGWHASLSRSALAHVDSAMSRGLSFISIGLSQAMKSAQWVNQHPVLVLAAMPVDGKFQTTSLYGMRRHPVLRRQKLHAGVDFAAKPGTPVVAAGKGVVLEAGFADGYGRLIVIDHGDGITTRYGHLRRMRVKAGQKVRVGQKIGNVGQSGRATGPHLHFEVRIHGEAVDPSTNVGFSLEPPVPGQELEVARRHKR
jgi:murein DD-endopeptidase MepM/ murein hydrolase activator NlpD